MQDAITKDIYNFNKNGNKFVQIKGKVCFCNSRTNEQIFVDVNQVIYNLMKEIPLEINYQLIPAELLQEEQQAANEQTQQTSYIDPADEQYDPEDESARTERSHQSRDDSEEANDPVAEQQDAHGVKVSWSRNAVLSLIAAYGEKEGAREPGQSNKKVWDLIAAQMEEEGLHYTAVQCKWKFSYLKGKYMKEKQSRGAGNTGGTSTNFKFFDEFEGIFHASHKHGLPISVSSSRYQKIAPKPVPELLDFEAPGLTDTDESNLTSEDIVGDISDLDARPRNSRHKRRVTVADTVTNAVEQLQAASKQRHESKLKIEERRFDLLEKRLEFEKQRHEDNMKILGRLINVMEGSNSSKPPTQPNQFETSDSE